MFALLCGTRCATQPALRRQRFRDSSGSRRGSSVSTSTAAGKSRRSVVSAANVSGHRRHSGVPGSMTATPPARTLTRSREACPQLPGGTRARPQSRPGGLLSPSCRRLSWRPPAAPALRELLRPVSRASLGGKRPAARKKKTNDRKKKRRVKRDASKAAIFHVRQELLAGPHAHARLRRRRHRTRPWFCPGPIIEDIKRRRVPVKVADEASDAW